MLFFFSLLLLYIFTLILLCDLKLVHYFACLSADTGRQEGGIEDSILHRLLSHLISEREQLGLSQETLDTFFKTVRRGKENNSCILQGCQSFTFSLILDFFIKSNFKGVKS